MGRYVDAATTAEMISERHNIDLADLVDTFAEIPSADVVEVRNGVWAEGCSHGVWHYDCPFCGDGYATKERQQKPENYCSNCGARMDGGSR